MQFIWALLLGLFVGALARLAMPGRDSVGVLVTMLLGVVGSVVGSSLGRFLGFYQAIDGRRGLIASLIGALIVLGLYRLSRRGPVM